MSSWGAGDPAREQALAIAVAHQVARGAAVAQRGDSWAIMTGVTPGDRVAHGLHLVLTLLSCGLWLPVWIFLAIVAKGPRQFAVRLDVAPDGRVYSSPVSPP